MGDFLYGKYFLYTAFLLLIVSYETLSLNIANEYTFYVGENSLYEVIPGLFL